MNHPKPKAQLRAEMKARRAAMSGQAMLSATESIHEHLLGLDQLLKARRVFTYVSSQTEPGTYTLIQELFEDGKRVSIPRIDPEGLIQAHVITSLDDLQPGGPDQFNLPVPAPDTTIEPHPEVAIVPGLAFTRTGQRLGMGGGHYDRYLAQHPDTFSVGLCYDWQLVEDLPVEPHDKLVDVIVCPGSVIRCSVLPG